MRAPTLLAAVALLLVMIGPVPAVLAHDPSAWGGLYRTRDGGATWFLANEGRFVTAALDLAIHPADPDRLLLATESGLLRSSNGGRDWEADPSPILRGAVFAIVLDHSGTRAMVSTGTDILVTDSTDSGVWRAVPAPSGAAPARQLVAGLHPNEVYLVGWTALARSTDWGETWQTVGDGLPSQAITRFLPLEAGPQARSRLLALVGGTVWTNDGDAPAWRRRDDGLPAQGVDTIVADDLLPGRLWAAGADQVFRSVDGGASWRPFGSPLNDRHTPIYGISAAPDSQMLLLSTDRGLYRSTDRGVNWELLADSVPVHLPTRLLIRDPREAATIYAGFSIRPYDALWQVAADGTSVFRRLDPVNLGGALAFLALLALGGGFAIQRLRRYYEPAPSMVAEAPRAIGERRPRMSPPTAAPLSEAGP